MLVVGLTGSMGMGKSTAAARFRCHGIAVFDADAEVHRLYEGGASAAIEAAFPDTTDGGRVNRQKLAASLGRDPARFKRLESIVHPLVQAAERAFLHERVPGRTWLAMIAAFAGMVLMFVESIGSGGLAGNLIALAIPLTFACNVVLLRKMHAAVDSGNAVSNAPPLVWRDRSVGVQPRRAEVTPCPCWATGGQAVASRVEGRLRPRHRRHGDFAPFKV